ncbi:MAG: FmdB family zinc ribbon protein [Desulfosporosinus sp.]
MYEFKCPSCGTVTIDLYKMGENGEQLKCTNCGHTGLKKKISGFASPGVSGGSGDKNCTPGCCGTCSGCH